MLITISSSVFSDKFFHFPPLPECICRNLLGSCTVFRQKSRNVRNRMQYMSENKYLQYIASGPSHKHWKTRTRAMSYYLCRNGILLCNRGGGGNFTKCYLSSRSLFYSPQVTSSLWNHYSVTSHWLHCYCAIHS